MNGKRLRSKRYSEQESAEARRLYLRGTFITYAYQKGYSIKQISEASGHSEREADRIIRDHYLAADLTIDVNEYRARD